MIEAAPTRRPGSYPIACFILAGLWACSSGTASLPSDACEDGTCDPAADDSTWEDSILPDTAPDPAADGVCDDAACLERCMALGYDTGECNEGGACSCAFENPGDEEECGDGLDNDGNGGIDEGCPCEAGDTQPCYSGPPITRGVGPCLDGTQLCQGMQELVHWGACQGEILPELEICDRLDNDCDGLIDEEAGCAWSCIPGAYAMEFNCDDGIDDECDGLIDCGDPDCPCCTPYAEDCGNGLDDDCDSFVDCDDADCTCCVPQPEDCYNGVDDDCDRRIDCNDVVDCMAVPEPEDCGNGIDDDCDGQTDCRDMDCCDQPSCGIVEGCDYPVCCVPGTHRWCDTPSFCAWGTQTCRPDGQWGTCSETSSRPLGCSTYYFSLSCCLSAGACCQNYPRDDSSVGNCDGIAQVCP